MVTERFEMKWECSAACNIFCSLDGDEFRKIVQPPSEVKKGLKNDLRLSP